MRFLVLHGPSMSRSYLRELPAGSGSDEVRFAAWLAGEGQRRGVQVDFLRRGDEEALCQAIEEAQGVYDAIIANFGLLRYTSLPLWSAIRASKAPCIEVIPSQERLPTERAPLTARACSATVSGLGLFSYQAVLDFLLQWRKLGSGTGAEEA